MLYFWKTVSMQECTAFLKGEPLFCARNYNFQRISEIIKIQMLRDTPSLEYNSLKIYISYFKWLDLWSNTTKMRICSTTSVLQDWYLETLKLLLFLQHLELAE